MITGAVDPPRGSSRERSRGEWGGRGCADSGDKELRHGLRHGHAKCLDMLCFVATATVPTRSAQQGSQRLRTQRPPGRRSITPAASRELLVGSRISEEELRKAFPLGTTGWVRPHVRESAKAVREGRPDVGAAGNSWNSSPPDAVLTSFLSY